MKNRWMKVLSADALVPMILSIFVVTVNYRLQGNIGLDLSDEGFLWYGVQRVMTGEIPLRDFMSYDPGRYFWSAFFMRLISDDGILSLRISVVLFQIIGIFLALRLISKQLSSNNAFRTLFLVMAALTLDVWMFPRHKLFDISLSIILIYAFSELLKQPSKDKFLISGVVIGFIAFFGRNHGVYGLAGLSMALLYLTAVKKEVQFRKAALSSLCGIFIGYLPMLTMMLLIPGFSESLYESVLLLIEQGSTNIQLPVRWPWRVNFHNPYLGGVIYELIIGAIYLLLMSFGVIGIVIISFVKRDRSKTSPILAGSFLSVPYAHFALSRADISHLAQSCMPVLLGTVLLICCLRIRYQLIAAAIITVLSFFVMARHHPFYAIKKNGNSKEMVLRGDTLLVESSLPKFINDVEGLKKEYQKYNETFLMVPFTPGIYAIFKEKCPLWEIYPLFWRGMDFQGEEIKRLQRFSTSIVIINNTPLDGNLNFRYSNTHQLIYQHIKLSYDTIQTRFLTSHHEVYIKN